MIYLRKDGSPTRNYEYERIMANSRKNMRSFKSSHNKLYGNRQAVTSVMAARSPLNIKTTPDRDHSVPLSVNRSSHKSLPS